MPQNTSSHSTSREGAGASSNKENRNPKCAVGPVPAKKRATSGKSPVTENLVKPVQKRSTSKTTSRIRLHWQTNPVEVGDSIQLVVDSSLDFEDFEHFSTSTPRKRVPETVEDTFDFSAYLARHDVTDPTWAMTPPPRAISSANDSPVPAGQRSSHLILPEDVTLEYSYMANGDCTFELSQELNKEPEERLLDESLSRLMNVKIGYSLEFPTGALGRVPHIFVARYKCDMKRKAAAEEAQTEKVPSLIVTSPSDGDLAQMAQPEVEFGYEDIESGAVKSHLLDSSLHNWNLRFNLNTMIFQLTELEDNDDFDINEIY